MFGLLELSQSTASRGLERWSSNRRILRCRKSCRNGSNGFQPTKATKAVCVYEPEGEHLANNNGTASFEYRIPQQRAWPAKDPNWTPAMDLCNWCFLHGREDGGITKDMLGKCWSIFGYLEHMGINSISSVYYLMIRSLLQTYI